MAVSNIPIKLSSVLFPLPLGPSKTTNVPRATVKSAFSNTHKFSFKHFYEGWKGDGGRRYQLAGDIIDFVKKTRPQVDNMITGWGKSGIINHGYDEMKKIVEDDKERINNKYRPAIPQC